MGSGEPAVVLPVSKKSPGRFSPVSNDDRERRGYAGAVMPMEGQWERLNTPVRSLTPRERFTGYALGAITAIALAVILVLHLGEGEEAPPPGCISAMVPWVMGGEQLQRCGERAKYLCANEATEDTARGRGILTACRESGLPTG